LADILFIPERYAGTGRGWWVVFYCRFNLNGAYASLAIELVAIRGCSVLGIAA
jgi:hypothetical protein